MPGSLPLGSAYLAKREPARATEVSRRLVTRRGWRSTRASPPPPTTWLGPLRARRRQGQGAGSRPDREGAGARGPARLRHPRLDSLPARPPPAGPGPRQGQRHPDAMQPHDPVPPRHGRGPGRRQGGRPQGPRSPGRRFIAQVRTTARSSSGLTFTRTRHRRRYLPPADSTGSRATYVAVSRRWSRRRTVAGPIS